uniref:Uncharacterized protein n=1 Tax=Lepeophtheirus salmonis TaxID=72036 RepID=A0A0K2UUK3_LEPSM
MGFLHCWCQMWPLHPQKALFTHFFLIGVWKFWCEIPRSLAWTIINLRKLVWEVFFNSFWFSLAFLTEPFFLPNVTDLLEVMKVVLETHNCFESGNGKSSTTFKSHFLE